MSDLKSFYDCYILDKIYQQKEFSILIFLTSVIEKLTMEARVQVITLIFLNILEIFSSRFLLVSLEKSESHNRRYKKLGAKEEGGNARLISIISIFK